MPTSRQETRCGSPAGSYSPKAELGNAELTNAAFFRRWVSWRYDSFAAYIKRLASGIRKKRPNAAVIINHLHRPGGLPWQTAIPLNPFDADIITGSEGTGEAIADLVMRLCRAYGRPQSEVCTSLDFAFTGTGADPDTSPATDQAIHHVLTCATAGGMPEFGGPHDNKAYKVWKHLSSTLDPIHPFITPRSVPYAALHISQQTDGVSMRAGIPWDECIGATAKREPFGYYIHRMPPFIVHQTPAHAVIGRRAGTTYG